MSAVVRVGVWRVFALGFVVRYALWFVPAPLRTGRFPHEHMGLRVSASCDNPLCRGEYL